MPDENIFLRPNESAESDAPPANPVNSRRNASNFAFDRDWPGWLRYGFLFVTMIGTIRKHSKWLWFVIITATIVSFVFYFSPSQRMGNGGGGGSRDLGSVYGKKITQDDYVNAAHDFELYYLFNYGEWPDKLAADQVGRETYIRLLLIHKADELGIYIGDGAAVKAADNILNSPDLARMLKIKNQTISPDAFVKEVLEPKGLTAADFENYVHHFLAIQQLFQTAGIAGELVTPQQATAIYQHENQELSAQIVFFSATNYLSQVTVAPAAVAQFYTNYLAAYRLPDRVQVDYVAFSVSNHLAQAKAEWAKTNFDEQIEAIYNQYGAQSFPEEKTPAAAKAKLREVLIQQRALADTRAQANDFATAVFNLDPARAENLGLVAKQKRLAVKTTEPFDEQAGPQEFTAPDGFTKAAFGLTADEPFAGPIAGPEAVYVIALAKTLPSEIPPLEEIRARVALDYQIHEATLLAQRVGTGFVKTLTTGMAGGKSFAAICVAAGLTPEPLPPFSLSTQELPELGDRAELNQLKQAAFSTAISRASDFEQTGDGGFVIYVQSQLPVDESKMNSEFPQFLASVRRARQNEAFNEWLATEIHKQFGNMDIFQKAANDVAR